MKTHPKTITINEEELIKHLNKHNALMSDILKQAEESNHFADSTGFLHDVIETTRELFDSILELNIINKEVV